MSIYTLLVIKEHFINLLLMLRFYVFDLIMNPQTPTKDVQECKEIEILVQLYFQNRSKKNSRNNLKLTLLEEVRTFFFSFLSCLSTIICSIYFNVPLCLVFFSIYPPRYLVYGHYFLCFRNLIHILSTT